MSPPCSSFTSLIFAMFALAIVGVSGCAWDLQTTRRVAEITNWGAATGVAVRRRPRNPLLKPMNMWAHVTGHGRVEPSDRANMFLRIYDLDDEYQRNPESVLSELRRSTRRNPDLDRLHVLAELAYLEGHRNRLIGKEQIAGQMLATSVSASYQYLFDTRLSNKRNAYDPVFRTMCDTYNAGLEGLLRIMKDREVLRPGGAFTATTLDGQPLKVALQINGRWQNENFEKFEFVADYNTEGLRNVHHTYGLGVPLIGVRKNAEHPEHAAEKYYPQGLTLPLTAFVTATTEPLTNTGNDLFLIQLVDPLEQTTVRIGNQNAPLESDISTPLAYYLDDPLIGGNWFATAALVNGDFARQFGGLYMLEPYDPTKIPVVMVHGFWSSPMTWTEMFNDLRADKAIRDNYQFWFYLYPSGQPFWLSAQQMRVDLAEVRSELDPNFTSQALNESVLVGHSMGGLLSRLQTIDSGDAFWKMVSDGSVNDMKGDPDTISKVRDTLFFNANPSIARVITVATPHRGSDVSNSFTQWLSEKFITLPGNITDNYAKLAKENDGLFKSDMLKVDNAAKALSAESPFFEIMMAAKSDPDVRYHNIIGVYEASGAASFLSSNKEQSDGVVAVASARIDGVESEIEVASEHSQVHEHPQAVLEVRRILHKHLEQVFGQNYRVRAEEQLPRQSSVVMPASYNEAEKDPTSGR